MKTPEAPLHLLRSFEAASRLGGFKVAARERSLTPAAISGQIRELEAQLGVALFVREARGVRLTAEGARYREHVAAALQAMDRATADLAQPAIDGPLRVTLPRSLATPWLLPRLGAFLDAYPGIQLRLDVTATPRDLRRAEADVALRFGAGRYPGLRARRLASDAVNVLIPTLSPETGRLDEPRRGLEPWRLWVDDSLREDEPWSGWPPWLREAGIDRVPEARWVHCRDATTALEACAAGLGACVSRRSMAEDLIEAGRVAPLFRWRVSEYAWFLLVREEDAESPRIRAFEGWIESLMAAAAWSGAPSKDAEPAGENG